MIVLFIFVSSQPLIFSHFIFLLLIYSPSVYFKRHCIQLLSILQFSTAWATTFACYEYIQARSKGRKNKTIEHSIEKNFISTTVVIAHDFTVHVSL